MSFGKKLNLCLGTLVLGAGLMYAAPVRAEDKPQEDSTGFEVVSPQDSQVQPIDVCVEVQKCNDNDKQKQPKPTKPAKPRCSDFEGHMCSQETVANSLGATESKEGYCPGKDTSYRCFDFSNIPNLSEKCTQLGLDYNSLLKESREADAALDKRVTDLTAQLEKMGLNGLTDNDRFYLAMMGVECKDELEEISKLSDLTEKYRTEMIKNEDALYQYVANASNKKVEDVKKLTPAQLLTESQGKTEPRLDQKQFEKLYNDFIGAKYTYDQAHADLTATVERISKEGCIDYKVQESNVTIEVGGVATYDPSTGAVGGNGEVRVLAGDSLKVGGYVNGGYEKSTTTKTHTEQPIPNLEQRTTETETTQRIAGAGAVGEVELGAGFTLYGKVGAAWKKKDLERKVEVGNEVIPVEKSENRYVGETSVGIDYELFENLGINLGGKCDTDEDCSVEGGLYFTF